MPRPPPVLRQIHSSGPVSGCGTRSVFRWPWRVLGVSRGGLSLDSLRWRKILGGHVGGVLDGCFPIEGQGLFSVLNQPERPVSPVPPLRLGPEETVTSDRSTQSRAMNKTGRPLVVPPSLLATFRFYKLGDKPVPFGSYEIKQGSATMKEIRRVDF